MMQSSAKYFAVSYLVFFIALSGLVSVCQGKASIYLGSTWDVPSEEISAARWLQWTIRDMARPNGYTVYSYYQYLTTKDYILDAAAGFGHSYAIVWYTGHGSIKSDDLHIWPYWWTPWLWHYHESYYIVDDDGAWVRDYEIYEKTGDRNVRFVFLWSCLQGNEIGYMKSYPCGLTRALGMPFAWLHTTDLSSNGYTNPDGGGYVFIGFLALAPFLTNDYVEDVTDGGKWFSYYFYYGAFWGPPSYEGLSIRGALDYAAQKVFPPLQKFEDCELYQGIYDENDRYKGRMVVYGDGNHKLV